MLRFTRYRNLSVHVWAYFGLVWQHFVLDTAVSVIRALIVSVYIVSWQSCAICSTLTSVFFFSLLWKWNVINFMINDLDNFNINLQTLFFLFISFVVVLLVLLVQKLIKCTQSQNLKHIFFNFHFLLLSRIFHSWNLRRILPWRA